MYRKNLFPLLPWLVLLMGKELLSQTIIPGGDVSGQWTAASSPYLVFDDVRIPPGSTLGIGPGVRVEFQGNHDFTVEGLLLASGMPEDSIHFTISDTAGFTDTVMAAGGWGGFRFLNRNAADPSLLRYCVVSYGKANGRDPEKRKGGGLYARQYTTLQVQHCRFHHNLALLDGGGIYYDESSSVTIEYCDISYNTAFRSGGGIYNGRNCDALVKNNPIHHNTALLMRVVPPYVSFSGRGGGFFASDDHHKSPRVINNYICNNKAVSGGGIYESTMGIIISGNVICNNDGSGIFNGHRLGEGKYSNNTICNNLRFGGIVTNSWKLDITGNILWNNINNSNSGVQIETDYGTPGVTYCNIQNGFPGEGNISDFPFFTGPTLGAGRNFDAMAADWTLLDISPCTNKAGPDTSDIGLFYQDLEGNPRIFDDRIDIGAFENQALTMNTGDAGDVPVTVNVFPNPTRGRVDFAFFRLLEGNIYFLSMNGQVMLIDHINRDKDRTFNLGGFPPGTYVWRIDDASGTIRGKIILEP